MRRANRWLLLFFFLLSFAFSLPGVVPATSLKKPLSWKHFTPKDGLSSEMVNTVAVQGEEVWFGTYAGGATLFDRSRQLWKAFTTKGEPLATADDGNSIRWKNLLSYNHVSVITPDVDRIWFGTYFYGFGGGGISYYQPWRKPAWRPFDTFRGLAKKIVAMAVDGEWLWVGSERGLSLLDKTSEQWKAFYSIPHGLSGNFVNALLVQSDFLWVATDGGISCFHKPRKTWKTYARREGLREGEVKALAKVGSKIWAGAADGMLFEFDPETDRWERIEARDPLKTGGIHSMLATKDTVFICRDNGVSLYDLASQTWESLTTSDGLLSPMVFGAAEDKRSIWFATDRGASELRLSP